MKIGFIIMWWLSLISCIICMYKCEPTYLMISNIYMWIGFLGQKLYK